jgi:hypothetical protein
VGNFWVIPPIQVEVAMSVRAEFTELDQKLGLVGLICFHWSYLELLLAASIWNILRIDETAGKIVTGGLNMEPRSAMATKLAKQRRLPQDFIDALSAAQEEIKTLEPERNLAIHGIYELRNGQVFAEVHRGKFKGDPQPMPTDRLRKLGLGILAIIDALWPAPGSEDTELGVFMELEVGHGETEVYARVQA